MICDFMSFSMVLQSCQDDVWVITKGCVQWNLVYSLKDFHRKQGSNRGPLDQKASA